MAAPDRFEVTGVQDAVADGEDDQDDRVHDHDRDRLVENKRESVGRAAAPLQADVERGAQQRP